MINILKTRRIIKSNKKEDLNEGLPMLIFSQNQETVHFSPSPGPSINLWKHKHWDTNKHIYTVHTALFWPISAHHTSVGSFQGFIYWSSPEWIRIVETGGGKKQSWKEMLPKPLYQARRDGCCFIVFPLKPFFRGQNETQERKDLMGSDLFEKPQQSKHIRRPLPTRGSAPRGG